MAKTMKYIGPNKQRMVVDFVTGQTLATLSLNQTVVITDDAQGLGMAPAGAQPAMFVENV